AASEQSDDARQIVDEFFAQFDEAQPSANVGVGDGLDRRGFASARRSVESCIVSRQTEQEALRIGLEAVLLAIVANDFTELDQIGVSNALQSPIFATTLPAEDTIAGEGTSAVPGPIGSKGIDERTPIFALDDLAHEQSSRRRGKVMIGSWSEI